MTTILVVLASVYSFSFGFLLSEIISHKNYEKYNSDEKEIYKVLIEQHNKKFIRFDKSNRFSKNRSH